MWFTCYAVVNCSRNKSEFLICTMIRSQIVFKKFVFQTETYTRLPFATSWDKCLSMLNHSENKCKTNMITNTQKCQSMLNFKAVDQHLQMSPQLQRYECFKSSRYLKPHLLKMMN